MYYGVSCVTRTRLLQSHETVDIRYTSLFIGEAPSSVKCEITFLRYTVHIIEVLSSEHRSYKTQVNHCNQSLIQRTYSQITDVQLQASSADACARTHTPHARTYSMCRKHTHTQEIRLPC